MSFLEGTVIGMNPFGNKEILNGGRISKFGTVSFQAANLCGLYNPIGQLYSNLLWRFRQEGYCVDVGKNVLFAFKSRGTPTRSIQADQIHFVRDIVLTRVTAGGWLARIDHEGKVFPYDRRDLPLVRKATKGIMPPAFSEKDFLRVSEEFKRRIMYVLAMGHPLFPVYRVFDAKGNPVSFWQEYPLSYSQWKKKLEELFSEIEGGKK